MLVMGLSRWWGACGTEMEETKENVGEGGFGSGVFGDFGKITADGAGDGSCREVLE